MTERKAKAKSEKQIPCGDDRQKGNGNNKGGRQKRRAALEAQPSFDLYI